MYRIKLWCYGGIYKWKLVCPANYTIALSNSTYRNKGSATYWARYWANKLLFKFEETS